MDDPFQPIRAVQTGRDATGCKHSLLCSAREVGKVCCRLVHRGGSYLSTLAGPKAYNNVDCHGQGYAREITVIGREHWLDHTPAQTDVASRNEDNNC